MIKWKQSISEGGVGAFMVFLLSGLFFLCLLFLTVHNRTDHEFKNRIDPRWENATMIWIQHGYFKHAGLCFLSENSLNWCSKSGDEDPKQEIWGNFSMGFVQINHLFQRIHFGLTGKSSPFLTAIHNQVLPMMAAMVLGLLAMRLSLGLGTPFSQAILLGISTQAVYQTFPIFLDALWNITPQYAAPPFMLFFLLIEERVYTKGDCPKLQFLRGLAVFFLFYVDHITGWLAFVPYIVIRVLTAPKGFSFLIVFRVIIIPIVISYGLFFFQLFLVKLNYPEISFRTNAAWIIKNSGFNGATTYYTNHIDLLKGRWLGNIPNWLPLFFLGSLATISVIIFVQLNKKYLIQQTTLLSGLGMVIPFAFALSQNAVVHPKNLGPHLAWVMILTLFALLPAWLEKFNQRPGIFILFASLAAFATSGLQLLSYWIHMPPWLVI